MTESSKPALHGASQRLWAQVSASPIAVGPGVESFPGAIVADLVASGVGAIVKVAADRLIATDTFQLRAVLPFDAAFVMRAGKTTAEFRIVALTLNVGDEAVPVDANGRPTDTSQEYIASPVVVRVAFSRSEDGTAIAGAITDWKYDRFIDSSWMPFRKHRKVTIELRVTDIDAVSLLNLSIQVNASKDSIKATVPSAGECLPWSRYPIKNIAGAADPSFAAPFGPVNIEASITEVAEPSPLAKVLGTVLSNQKAAIETYVKQQVTQSLDASEAAKAKLALVKEASTALEDYGTAYKAVVDARKSIAVAANDVAKATGRQVLTLTLATLQQKETVTRITFDHAGLTFQPLPRIPDV